METFTKVIILLLLAGCSHNTHVNDFCLIYEPIYISDYDTDETVYQVLETNKIFEDLCE